MHACGCKCGWSNKGNLVLYLDKDLIRESKELGFNLSRTFENHLKQLITQFHTHKNRVQRQFKGINYWKVGRAGVEPATFGS